jgi:hypothetical protein
VGSTASDRVGSYDDSGNSQVATLASGGYVVWSPYWRNVAASRFGAVTWCDGTVGCSGPVSGVNSVLGTTAGGGAVMTFAFDSFHDQLLVGRPADNRVTLFKTRYSAVYLPLLSGQ